jgi:anti-sigma regulatory factor (Ser/Thr protein kinase)
MEITRTFDSSPAAPAMARHSLDKLARTIPSERMDDLRLIVSELVTNSVSHAGLGGSDRIQMTVEVSRSRLRVEVANRGHGFTTPRARVSSQHGRGLLIVDRLADRWGSQGGAETTVWAELSLPGRR